MRSRMGPPNNAATGTPYALPVTSSSAFSIAAIACWLIPPRDWRVSTCRCCVTCSYLRGSLPISTGDNPRITSDSPMDPKLSLNSDQPTMPSSVVTLRKENMRQPASAWNVSTRSIFMLPPASRTGRVQARPDGSGKAASDERHFRRPKPFEADTTRIPRLQVAKPRQRSTRHELARAHATRDHVHQRDCNAEWISRWMPAHLLQHRRAIHRQRHLQLAQLQATPI